MFAALSTAGLVAPADSAQAVAQVYSVSLLATLPLLAAAGAGALLRGAGAGTRVLVWKSAVAALLVVCVGRLLPLQWVAWIVPTGLATPLVALGQLHVVTSDLAASTVRSLDGSGPGVEAADTVRLLFVVYCAGVAAVLVSLGRALAAAHGVTRRAGPVHDEDWASLLREARDVLRVRRAVRLLVSRETSVPVTWGVIRPVVLLPSTALAWSREHRRAVLLHEVGHIRRADGAFAIAARIACALLWFHPAVWLVARALAAETELACDDLVLHAGVRRSDYAELLMLASDRRAAPCLSAGAAVAMSSRVGLRRRLDAIVDAHRAVRVPARSRSALAAVLTLAVAFPVGTAQLAPTRAVLTTLMEDARWESRAYAVTGLAQRRDSVEVALTAARHDPSPRVRAWALFALTQPSARALTAASPERIDKP